jgi:hypothetical protein
MLAAGAPPVEARRGGDRPPDIASLNGPVAALTVYNGDVIAGGEFTQGGAGETVQYLARWDPQIGWLPLGDQPDGPVAALAVVGDALVVGGNFENIGSLAASHIAKYESGVWSAFGQGANGPVLALAVQAGVVLYVGGAFTEVDGPASREPCTRSLSTREALSRAVSSGPAAPTSTSRIWRGWSAPSGARSPWGSTAK